MILEITYALKNIFQEMFSWMKTFSIINKYASAAFRTSDQ